MRLNRKGRNRIVSYGAERGGTGFDGTDGSERGGVGQDETGRQRAGKAGQGGKRRYGMEYIGTGRNWNVKEAK